MSPPTPPRTGAPAAPSAAVRLRTPRRPARTGTAPRRSVLLTLLTGLVRVYSLVPLAWLAINATKTQQDLFDSFGLWFSGDFALFANIAETLTYWTGIRRCSRAACAPTWCRSAPRRRATGW
ncbi:hypothetical protein [Streptomonospora salina]|uniref:ABC-type glycerol-3-phosphate transport system permease component n=1 Tax=Streptomonospora salina TaxID=104205 RepID=A0A841EMS0_9ACTN|nr:hypothetical protein [Streptomonospora salina]MBB6000721.1 ABC-type glycerol-3-phosphate transport system permease component [Streptomonospora salina]